MAQTVTNIKASQALRGQAVLVTLTADEAQDFMGSFSAGMLCTVQSSGQTGTIRRVDYNGVSFLVDPIQPNTTFASAGEGVYGYLAVSEGIDVDN